MRKIANDDLDKMNHQEVPATDTEELADIRDVRIDPKSSKEEKLRTFLEPRILFRNGQDAGGLPGRLF